MSQFSLPLSSATLHAKFRVIKAPENTRPDCHQIVVEQRRLGAQLAGYLREVDSREQFARWFYGAFVSNQYIELPRYLASARVTHIAGQIAQLCTGFPREQRLMMLDRFSRWFMARYVRGLSPEQANTISMQATGKPPSGNT